MERINLKTIPTIVQNVKEEDTDEDYSEFIPSNKPKSYNVEKLIKMSAMACACTFGVGSHFAIHIIGPLKGILMEVRYKVSIYTLTFFLYFINSDHRYYLNK